MSTIHLVRCEQYESCRNEFTFDPMAHVHKDLPQGWFTLFPGNPNLTEGWHFCSDLCLARWLINRIATSGANLEKSEDWLVRLTDTPVWSIVRKPVQQEPQEQPACKARRFLMWDESANCIEGVKFGNESVMLEGTQPDLYAVFYSWDALKAAHEGSGVQWIDQEVFA